MLKKCKMVLLSLALLIANVIPAAPAFAAADAPGAVNKPDKVLFENPPITDIQALYIRANNGISDVHYDPKVKTVKGNKGHKIEVKEIATAQKIKTVEMSDGTIVDTYATTQMILTSEPLPTPVPDDRDSGTVWDESVSVSAYSTIYWNRYTRSDGYDFVKLTRVTGGWGNQYSNITLSNRLVRMNELGQGWSGAAVNVQSNSIPSSNTFTAYAPTSWEPVHCGTAQSIGATTTVTITRYGESWSLTCANNTKG